MRHPNRNLLRGAAGGLRPSLNTSLPKIPGVDGTGSGDPYGIGEKGGNTFSTFDNSSSHHSQQQQQSGSPNGFPHSTSSHSNLASSGETFHNDILHGADIGTYYLLSLTVLISKAGFILALCFRGTCTSHCQTNESFQLGKW